MDGCPGAPVDPPLDKGANLSLHPSMMLLSMDFVIYSYESLIVYSPLILRLNTQ